MIRRLYKRLTSFFSLPLLPLFISSFHIFDTKIRTAQSNQRYFIHPLYLFYTVYFTFSMSKIPCELPQVTSLPCSWRRRFLAECFTRIYTMYYILHKCIHNIYVNIYIQYIFIFSREFTRWKMYSIPTNVVALINLIFLYMNRNI